MRLAMLLVFSTFLFCRLGIAQESKEGSLSSKLSAGIGKVYVVQF